MDSTLEDSTGELKNELDETVWLFRMSSEITRSLATSRDVACKLLRERVCLRVSIDENVGYKDNTYRL